MKTKEQLEEQMIKNKLMRTYEEIDLYEESVNNLFDENDYKCIFFLIKGFHDETENNEVMYSNLHGIEYFSKTLGLNKYVEVLLPILNNMGIEAVDWAERFYFRLLNSDEAYESILRNITNLNPQNLKFIAKLNKNLQKDPSGRFEAKATTILNKIEEIKPNIEK